LILIKNIKTNKTQKMGKKEQKEKKTKHMPTVIESKISNFHSARKQLITAIEAINKARPDEEKSLGVESIAQTAKDIVVQGKNLVQSLEDIVECNLANAAKKELEKLTKQINRSFFVVIPKEGCNQNKFIQHTGIEYFALGTDSIREIDFTPKEFIIQSKMLIKICKEDNTVKEAELENMDMSLPVEHCVFLWEQDKICVELSGQDSNNADLPFFQGIVDCYIYKMV